MKRSLIIVAATLVSLSFATQTAERPKELDTLDYFAGKWTSPATDTQKDSSEYTGEWVLGKRHFRMVQSGTVMGMKMEGMMMMTWDETRKQYSSTWFDSLGGMVVTGYGEWKGDTITFITASEEFEGQKMRLKTSMTKLGPDKFLMDVSGGDGDKWQSFVKLTFNRKK